MSSSGKKKKTLHDLSRTQPGEEELSAAAREYSKKGNDKVSTLLHAAILESFLITCLQIKLDLINPLIDHADTEPLFFKDNAVLGSFESKIYMAYHLGVYDKDVRDDLNRIRKIRNVFAHAAIPVELSTHEIKEECSKLILKKRKGFNEHIPRDQLYASYLNILGRLSEFLKASIDEFPPENESQTLPQKLEQPRYLLTRILNSMKEILYM